MLIMNQHISEQIRIKKSIRQFKSHCVDKLSVLLWENIVIITNYQAYCYHCSMDESIRQMKRIGETLSEEGYIWKM